MSAAWYGIRGQDLVLHLRIQPRAGREDIGGLHAGRLRVRIAAPPVEGAANDRLLGLLAERLKWPRSAIALLRGARSRDKDVLVAGAAARHAELLARLVGPEP